MSVLYRFLRRSLRRFRPGPDLPEPLLGYRFWLLGDDGLLRSWVQDYTWIAGPNEARCLVAAPWWPFRAPHPRCSCGFYALKRPQGNYIRANCKHFIVPGVVALWGKVWEHEEGYRAQWAQPLVLHGDLRLCVDPDEVRLCIDRAAAIYNLDVMAVT